MGSGNREAVKCLEAISQVTINKLQRSDISVSDVSKSIGDLDPGVCLGQRAPSRTWPGKAAREG